jgi:hypothetical protein
VKFTQLENALTVCKNHLDNTGTRGTEIESYLVGFLLVNICSEFEIRLRKILEMRAAHPGDTYLSNFVVYASGRIIRSIKIGEIAGYLGGFGTDWKDNFHSAVKDKPPHVAYDNIMANRQLVAHVSGTMMTFAELEAAFQEACHVLTAVANAVGLTPAEIASLG